MCLTCMNRREAHTSQDILSIGDQLKMIWIYALTHAAKMVYSQAIRNRTLEHLIGDAMSILRTKDVWRTLDHQLAVAGGLA
jgi:hypothetical protein